MVRSGEALLVTTPRRCTTSGSFGSACDDAVLHLHLRLVDVGAQGERDGERHDAVGGRLRGLIQHALDTVDRLLERDSRPSRR